MSSVIELKNVNFSYASNQVLKDVSLKIAKGDFVGLVGRNGSGKTTLIKLIIGELKPQSGEVAVEAGNNVGYVEQITYSSDASFPASVLEIVLLGLYKKIGFFKFVTKKHKTMALNALKIVGMEKYYNSQISLLSGGEQQRVIIAKALAANPDILILDEPTTGIDNQSEKEFLQLLCHLNEEHGKTIVISTHSLNKLARVSRVLTVDDKNVKEGSHAKV